jgi:hypothetical protein
MTTARTSAGPGVLDRCDPAGSGSTPRLKAPARAVDGMGSVAYPEGTRSAFSEIHEGRHDNLRTSPSVGVARARRRALGARGIGARSASPGVRSVRGLRGACGSGRRCDSLDAVRASEPVVRSRASAAASSIAARGCGGSRRRLRGRCGCARRNVPLFLERRTTSASAGAAGRAAVRSSCARPTRARRRLLASLHLPAEIARIDWPRSAGVCARPLMPTPPLQESD